MRVPFDPVTKAAVAERAASELVVPAVLALCRVMSAMLLRDEVIGLYIRGNVKHLNIRHVSRCLRKTSSMVHIDPQLGLEKFDGSQRASCFRQASQ